MLSLFDTNRMNWKITYGNVAVKYEILPNDATPLLKAANTMIQAKRSESTKGYSKFPSVSMPGVILRTVSLRKKKEFWNKCKPQINLIWHKFLTN